jgi:creatinine amidohydrolase/Fe(II)-dependent formamide hydrolase-like protein
MTPDAMEGYPFDHAGAGETSLMMALSPAAVDLSRLSEDKWYASSARQASVELGRKGRDCVLAGLRRALGG